MPVKDDWVDGDSFGAGDENAVATAVNANTTAIATKTGKYTATIGDGSTTSIVVTHSLGTTACVCSVREASGGLEVDCDKTYNSTTQITLGFETAPATNSLTVTVIG